MKAVVTVEFESFGDLTTALYETIRAIKVHAKSQLPDKKVLDRSLAEPVPFELDGDNCYGSFEIIVTDEEAPPTPAPEVKEEKGFYCDAEKNGAGRCSMICRMCYEEAPPACPEPVKEDQYDQFHPQDYSGKNAPTEQPAHVPDPKGETHPSVPIIMKP